MRAQTCKVGLWLFILVALLLSGCASTPTPGGSAATPEVAPQIQIVREDPGPDPFIGVSYYGLVWDLIFAGALWGLFLWARKVRRGRVQEWPRRYRLATVLWSVIAVVWCGEKLLDFVGDFLVTWWAYQEMGYLYRWQLELVTRTGLLVAVGSLTFWLLSVLVRPVVKTARAKLAATEEPPEPGPEASHYYRAWESRRSAWRAYQWLRRFPTVVKALIGFVSLIGGLVFAAEWLTVLMFLNQVPWGVVDPVFGMDISFFVFALPVIELVYNTLYWLLFLGGVGVAAGYVVLNWDEDEPNWAPALRHVGAIAALWFLATAFGLWLGRFALLFNEGAKYSGITTSQYVVELTARVIMVVLTALVAIITLIASRYPERILGFLRNNQRPQWKTWLVASGPYSLLFVLMVLSLVVVPAIYYGVRVSTMVDENQKEQISWNIVATRDAFGLSKVQVVEQEIQLSPDPEALLIEREPWVSGVRSWNWDILERYFEWRQGKVAPWGIYDVDVTSLTLGGLERLVMCSLREAQPEKPELGKPSGPTKSIRVISSLDFVCADPSQVDAEHYPVLIAQEIPVQTAYPEMAVEKHRMYYSETVANIAYVRAKVEELSAPGFATPPYEGKGGFPLTLPRRVVLGWQQKSWAIWMGTYFTPETRVLLNKSIVPRVRGIVEGLGVTLEWDPYLAWCGDRLCFLWDGYATTDRYPEATAYKLAFVDTPWRKGYSPEVRYFRNSVKVVVDAYDGTVTLYVADESDPIIRTLSRTFPGMFRSIAEMPVGLRGQIRLAETGFNTLLKVSEKYHVTNPIDFWNNRDLWVQAAEMVDVGQAGTMESRYYIGTLPGQRRSEFLLVNVLSPATTRNLSGVMVARNDGEHYGEILLYRLNTGEGLERITGPADAEIRADQVSQITSALRNWEARGNWVVPGNLIVLFVGPPGKAPTIVYVEPIHLVPKDPKGAPTLNLVILIPLKGRVAYHEDLPRALKALRGEIPSYAPVISIAGEEAPAPGPSPVVAPPAITPSVDCTTLRQQLDDAEARYDGGDFSAAADVARLGLEFGLRCGAR